MRGPLAALAGLVCAAALAGCGEEPRTRPEPRVSVRLTTPADAVVVRGETVEVAGRVVPADARVTVLGRDADVRGGTFSTRVALAPGPNIVDVAATAPGRRAGFAALRIVREIRVRVPDLTGEDAGAAAERLADLGLEVSERRGGGLFDPLLPGDPRVCESVPGPGAELLPGSTVELVVARDCS